MYKYEIKTSLPSEYPYKVGAIIQGAIVKEAETIQDYSERLEALYHISDSLGKEMSNVIDEIIADELDHIDRLNQLYSAVTKIEPQS